MRNGVIADALRRGGSPFKIIFGLNLPQIREIATELGQRPDLAQWLWDNSSTRESMLLAPMLISSDTLSYDQAVRMIEQSPSTEIIDSLCHSLLRHTPEAYRWATHWATDHTTALRYAALRILWHFIASHSTEILPLAEAELLRSEKLTAGVASQIIDEIDFLQTS